MAWPRPPPLSLEEVRRVRLHRVWNKFSELQECQGEGETADAHFICADGVIPAHTAILAHVSPVLNALFLSQGADYFGIRTVLLPEYPTSEIERMLELIYRGSVNVASEEDANNLRKLLREFRILDMDKLQFGVRTGPEPKPLFFYRFESALLRGAQGTADASNNSGQVVDQGTALGTLLARAPVPTTTRPAEPEPNLPPGDVEMEEVPQSTSAAATTSAKTDGAKSVEKQSSDSDDDVMFVEVVSKPRTKNIQPLIVDIEMKTEPISEQNSVQVQEPESESEDEVENSGPVSEPKEPESVPVSPASKSDSETSDESPPVKRRIISSKKVKKVSEDSQSSNQSNAQDQNSDDPEGGTPVTPQRPVLRPRSKATPTPSPASAKANPGSSSSNQSGGVSVSTLAVPANPGNRPSSAKKPSPSARIVVTARDIYTPTPSPPGTPNSATPPDPPNRSLRPRVNLKSVVLESDDDAGIPSSSSESNEEGFKKYPKTRRGKARISGAVGGSSDRTGSKKSGGKHAPKKRPSTPAAPPPPQNVAPAEERERGSGSGSESENDGQEPSFYKDPKRIFEEAKVCRGCNKKYTKPRDASDCVTEKHKLVRCYFCFRVFKNTELLFEHYKKDHRKAGKEDHLICPYCQNSVPHRSVSTHVISNHIFNQNATPTASANSGAGPSRTSTAAPVTPKKKSLGGMKLLREEKVGATESESDDDELSNGMVMKKKSSDGNVRVFFLSDKGKKK